MRLSSKIIGRGWVSKPSFSSQKTYPRRSLPTIGLRTLGVLPIAPFEGTNRCAPVSQWTKLRWEQPGGGFSYGKKLSFWQQNLPTDMEHKEDPLPVFPL